MPHLNKQTKNTIPTISRQDYHLTQPCPSEEKQTKTHHKSHPIQSSNKPLDQTSEGRNQRKKEFNPESWEKETSNRMSFKKKMQRSTTQRKEKTRNREVQINEEEIGKLPEKEFRIMIVKMIKNLENKMEKMQESIKKT